VALLAAFGLTANLVGSDEAVFSGMQQYINARPWRWVVTTVQRDLLDTNG
jgi:hypothetical protein